MRSIVDEAISRLHEAARPVPDPRKFAQSVLLDAAPPPDRASGQVGGVESTAVAADRGDTDKPRKPLFAFPLFLGG